MRIVLFFCFLHIFLFPEHGAADEVKQQIEQPVEKAISIMQNTQKIEETWRQLQEKLTAELELLETHVNQLKVTRDQQKEQILHTQTRIAHKKQQLDDIRRIEKEMAPFLSQLMTRLSKLPQQDLPFLQDERRERITKLREILNNPEISVSEQYRKAMETLLIEADFGVTIETYQEMLEHDQQTVLVNILRLGRLGLYYVTLDEGGCGFFNVADNRWQPLPDKYIYPLQTAVAIAGKQRPAEFITMPLGKIVP